MKADNFLTVKDFLNYYIAGIVWLADLSLINMIALNFFDIRNSISDILNWAGTGSTILNRARRRTDFDLHVDQNIPDVGARSGMSRGAGPRLRCYPI